MSVAACRCKRQILLVEDEARLRDIIARYVRMRGHAVTEAGSASDATEALSERSFDILLLDISLPDDTGWSVLRRLDATADGALSPLVIVLSAVPPSPKRIAQFAPDAVLNKPFPIDALARLVESACQVQVVEGDLGLVQEQTHVLGG